MRYSALGPLAVLGLWAWFTTGPMEAQEKKEKGKTGEAMTLKVGAKAPGFQGTDDAGKTWKSSDHVGKKLVVLFFFPAALTGG